MTLYLRCLGLLLLVMLSQNIFAAIVRPALPQTISAERGDSLIVMQWSTATNATSYEVILDSQSRLPRNPSPDFQSFTNISGNQLIIQNLNSSTKYYIKLRSISSTGTASRYSQSLTPPVTAPGQPLSLSTLTLNPNDVQLNWVAADLRVTTYRLTRRSLSNNLTVTLSSTIPGNANNYIDTGLTPGETYHYELVAANSAGESLPTAADYLAPPSPTTLLPGTPLYLTVTTLNATGAQINWQPADGLADGFNVLRAISGAIPQPLATQLPANAAFFADLTVVPGSDYQYYVEAYNANGNSPAATINYKAPVWLSMPSGFSVKNVSATSVLLSWNVDSGATSYKLYRALQGDSNFTIINAAIPGGTGSYNDNTLLAATAYDYRLLANNILGDSPPATLTYLPPPGTPTNFVATGVSESIVELSWNEADTLAEAYVLLRGENGGTPTVINNNIPAGAGLIKYQDSGLLTGVVYDYEVYAVNAGGISDSAFTRYYPPSKLGAPLGFSAQVNNGPAVNLSWQTGDNATTRYEISRALAGSANFILLNGNLDASQLSFNDTSVASASSYDYRLQGFDLYTASDAVFVYNVSIPSLPAAPTNLAFGDITADAAPLSWVDNSNNENNFLLQRAEQTGPSTWTPFTTIKTLDANSVVGVDDNTSAPPYQAGSHYKYRVGAENIAGSAFSNEITTVAPPQDSFGFLAFLNKSAPRFQETAETAQAYYDAIDPNKQKTTVDAWKLANGFGGGGSQDIPAVYLNDADLGFARRMYVNQEVSGSQPGIFNVASYVENYATIEDAMSGDPTKLIATVAMEYTEPAQASTEKVVLAQSPNTSINSNFVVDQYFRPGNYKFFVVPEHYIGDDAAKFEFSIEEVSLNPDFTESTTTVLNDPNGTWPVKAFYYNGTGRDKFQSDFSARSYTFTVPESSYYKWYRLHLTSEYLASIAITRQYKVIDTAVAGTGGGSAIFSGLNLAAGDYALVVGSQDPILQYSSGTSLAGVTIGDFVNTTAALYVGSNNSVGNAHNFHTEFFVDNTTIQPFDITVTPDSANPLVITPVIYLLDGSPSATGSNDAFLKSTTFYNENYYWNIAEIKADFSAGNYEAVVGVRKFGLNFNFSFSITDTTANTVVPCSPDITTMTNSQGLNPFINSNPRCGFNIASSLPLRMHNEVTSDTSIVPELNVLGGPGDFRHVVAYADSQLQRDQPRVAMTQTLNAGNYTVIPLDANMGEFSNYELTVTNSSTGAVLVSDASSWNPSPGLDIEATQTPRYSFNVASNSTPIAINLTIPAVPGSYSYIKPVIYLLDSANTVIAQDDGERHQRAVVEADLLKGDYIIAVSTSDYMVKSKVSLSITDQQSGSNKQFSGILGIEDSENPYSPNALQFPYTQAKMGHVRLELLSDYYSTVYILGKGDRKIVTFYTFIGNVGLDGLTNGRKQPPPAPFYPPDLAEGDRVLAANLDGRGDKYQPGLCNVCHGGAPKTLLNGVYPDHGNTNSGFLSWDMDLFKYAPPGSGYERATLEPVMREFNRTVLSVQRDPTYAVPGLLASQTARNQMIYGWYGGANLPRAFDGNYVPPGWVPDSQSGVASGVPDGADQLYLEVVKPTCRLCHVQRETLTHRTWSEYEAPITFKNYRDFMAYKDEIQALVYDNAEMPLAKRTFDHFWSKGQGDLLAKFLNSPADANGNAVQPGTPIAATPYTASLPTSVAANADLTRYMMTGSTITLNGNASKFVDSFSWTVVSSPTGAASDYVLAGANTATPAFTANVEGDYALQLIATNNKGESKPARLPINASTNYTPVSFSAQLMPVFDPVNRDYQYPDAPTRLHPFSDCVGCHSRREEYLLYYGPNSISHSVLYNANTYLWSLSGNADSVYANLVDRVNLINPLDSRVLNVGSRAHHLPRTPEGWGFDDYTNTWEHFNLMLRWVNEGAPKN